MSHTYIPTSVNLTSSDPTNEIPWTSIPTSSVGFLVNSRWSTLYPLRHRSNPACGDLRDRTWDIVCTNFNMTVLPSEISGLQLDILGQRNGRIVDDMIQLTYQGLPIGNNNFQYVLDADGHFYLDNQTTYGGTTDLWGIELTPELLQDPSFGVILKFQSHPYYPHSCGMFLDSVSITVY